MADMFKEQLINYVYPLEVPDKIQEVDQTLNDNDGHSLQHAGHVKESERAPKESQRAPIRRAALTARQRINQLLKTNALTVTFN